MLNKLLVISCFLLSFFTSCQKDVTKQPTVVNGAMDEENALALAATGVPDLTSQWYGTYDGYFGPYIIVQDDDFIKNGAAKMPYLDRQFSYSKLLYDIPAKYNIQGDSIAFEAKVKNPKSSGFSDYDIVLQLTGELHSAEVHFVANKDYVKYTQYRVGDADNTELSELVHLFGTFQTIKLAQKNYYTAVYINNNLVYKFKYGKKNSIGRLKTINIAFKGYGSCTSVVMKNSFDKTPILSEDFNTDGQSNTIYY